MPVQPDASPGHFTIVVAPAMTVVHGDAVLLPARPASAVSSACVHVVSALAVGMGVATVHLVAVAFNLPGHDLVPAAWLTLVPRLSECCVGAAFDLGFKKVNALGVGVNATEELLAALVAAPVPAAMLDGDG